MSCVIWTVYHYMDQLYQLEMHMIRDLFHELKACC